MSEDHLEASRSRSEKKNDYTEKGKKRPQKFIPLYYLCRLQTFCKLPPRRRSLSLDVRGQAALGLRDYTSLITCAF